MGIKTYVHEAEVILTRKEVDSPNPIKVILHVKIDGEESSIDYTLEYPKKIPKALPSLDEIREFISKGGKK